MFTEYLIYLFVLSGLAWILIYAQASFLLKSFYVVALITLSLTVFNRIARYQGEPKPTTQYTDFIHYASIVDEHNGKIYIWLVPTGIDRPPISVVIPYDRVIHEGLQAGVQDMKGHPFRVQLSGGPFGEGKGDAKNGREGEGTPQDGEGSGSISLESSTNIDVSVIPNPVMPEKQ